MPLIQFFIPADLDKSLKLEMIKREAKTKADLIISLLEEKVKEDY